MVEVRKRKCRYLKDSYCTVRAKELAHDRDGNCRECERCREGRVRDGRR